MKRIFIIFIGLLLIGTTADAQFKGSENRLWESTDFDFHANVGGRKDDPGTAIREIHAVSTEIAWATFSDWQVPNAPTLNKVAYTTDGGASWITVAGPGGNQAQYSNICAIDEKTAWIAVHTSDPGLYHTSDAGITWTKVDGLFEDVAVMCNFVYFWDKDNGFAQGDVKDGVFTLYTTSDGGATWTPNSSVSAAGSELGGVAGMYGVATDGTLWWQSDQGRAFKTTDKGISFASSETGLKNTNQQQGLKVMDANTVIFPAFDTSSKTYSYKITTNGGASWESWTPLGANETYGTFGFTSVPGTNFLVSISSEESTTGGEDNFISYCADGKSGEEWTIFPQWIAAEQDKTQMTYVKFFNFDGTIKGYASSFNYGPTYKGLDGILVWDGTLKGIGISSIQKSELNIYPNPATEIIYVTNVKNVAKISLSNMLGQTIKTVENPQGKAQITTSDIEKGFYIITVETNEGQILTNKVLVK